MVLGSENSCPSVCSSSLSARQLSSLELLFPNLLQRGALVSVKAAWSSGDRASGGRKNRNIDTPTL
jgi:hypothetical protein